MDQFSQATHVAVRTFRSSGTPVATPVWATVIEGRLYFGTPEHTHKVTRIRRNPHVQLAVCDGRGTTRGPWTDGHARLLTTAEFAAHKRCIDRRHPIASRLVRLVARLRGWNYIGVEITHRATG